MGIMVFSMIVLVTLLATAVVVFVVLARWPGQTAQARNHPYAEAVTIAGWVGLLAGGVLWPLALVWAYLTPPPVEPAGDTQ
jgi:hypothetical protein